MKTLVLNCGSSSIKYKLFDMTSGEVMAQGGIEKVGLPDSFLKFTDKNGEKVILEKAIPDHTVGIAFILDTLTDAKYGCLKNFKDINAVGHRVVHGAEKFASSVLITKELLEKVKECTPLAPLHNPANLKGIEAMPDYAYLYALPYRMYKDYGVRRYGFHGTSHRYVSRRACEILGVPYESQRIITAHIGNGASITAIKGGKSIDTSMGMTPTEGLMMGTRSGDVDPGALPFIMHKENLDADGLAELLNKKSGMAGFSEISSDMRDIEGAIESGNKRAALALAIYDYRIKKYIGAYAAALGGLDILVFTGGVGENQDSTREVVCRDMEFLGLEFDAEKNRGVRGREVVISKPSSRVKVLVVPTDEEYMIASDTCEILKGK